MVKILGAQCGLSISRAYGVLTKEHRCTLHELRVFVIVIGSFAD
jgi:hypothetical protein